MSTKTAENTRRDQRVRQIEREKLDKWNKYTYDNGTKTIFNRLIKNVTGTDSASRVRRHSKYRMCTVEQY